jgi:hypothetical protein
MTRNQKIALGCGGAGCLGLIVVAIAGGLIYFFARSATNRDYNFNVSTNRNSNTNDNSDLTSNSNDNTSNSSNSSSSSSTSLSEDDQHKLYQAAIMTRDAELLRRVEVKLGLRDDDYTPGSKYETFVTEHVGWSIRNLGFIGSLDTAEKARAYVNDNFPE